MSATGPRGYVDKAGAAEYTAVSKRTLDYARQDGLRYHRVGRKVVFKIEDLDRWMDARCVDVDAVRA